MQCLCTETYEYVIMFNLGFIRIRFKEKSSICVYLLFQANRLLLFIIILNKSSSCIYLLFLTTRQFRMYLLIKGNILKA